MKNIFFVDPEIHHVGHLFQIFPLIVDVLNVKFSQEVVIDHTLQSLPHGIPKDKTFQSHETQIMQSIVQVSKVQINVFSCNIRSRR